MAVVLSCSRPFPHLALAIKSSRKLVSMGKGAKKQGNKRGAKKGPHSGRKGTSSGTPPPPRRRKLEITFDPDARKEYVTGFASRKKERRAYGLAMQKVKDRKAKLEQRKTDRDARKEREEEQDAMRRSRMEEENEEEEGGDGDDGSAAEMRKGTSASDRDGHGAPSETTTFEDETTRSNFGGSVVVTTTFGVPYDDTDDDASFDAERRRKRGPTKGDEEQRYAGSVKRYMEQLKGNMPSKKKKRETDRRSAKKGGKHGAASMKGMGNATEFKMAQKVLGRAEAKGAGMKGGKKAGSKKRRGR